MSYYSLTFGNLSRRSIGQLPIVRVEPDEERAPRRAIEAIRRGQIVVFPTDTVYGLGCRIDDERAVRRIFEIKRRPLTDALPILLAGPDQLDLYVRLVPADAYRLIARYWPGPLTLVMLRSSRIPPLVAGGGDTVAIRVPGHPIPRALIRGAGVPIVGTSANSHGMAVPVTAQHAVYDLGDWVDLVIDGGRAAAGRESTVIDLTGGMPRVIREGAIPARELRDHGITG